MAWVVPKTKEETLNFLKENGKSPRLLAFITQEECGACEKAKPILEEFEKENPDFLVFQLKAELVPDLIVSMGVTGTPTFIFSTKGRFIGTATGTPPSAKELKLWTDECFDTYRKEKVVGK
jgi:thiol-disulfide isomerase/thioredoxin